MLETIWNSILPNILEIVITIISVVIARYVIPCIKNDLVPWLKEKHLHNIVKNFVQAAEKLAESGVIAKESKKEKVIELLESKGIIVDHTIDAFIESCVKELDIVTSVICDEIFEVQTDVKTKEN